MKNGDFFKVFEMTGAQSLFFDYDFI